MYIIPERENCGETMDWTDKQGYNVYDRENVKFYRNISKLLVHLYFQVTDNDDNNMSVDSFTVKSYN